MLDLKANPNKRAVGSVVESSLDKGRGYLATVLVQAGTLHVGDVVLAGCYTGRVKAMFNERGQKITEAGPSTPVSVLGLNGAPTAGDTINVLEDEKEAKDIANKREQLLRMQGIRAQQHVTLEEIGRRIAIGNFKELNIIVKADVDGSIEALSDSLIKLSTEEVKVNVIHKAVGAISESDVLLAAASNAIIIGFQVRPSVEARRQAEKRVLKSASTQSSTTPSTRSRTVSKVCLLPKRRRRLPLPPRFARPSRSPRSAPSPAVRSRRAS